MPVIVTSAGSVRWNAAPAAVFASMAVWLSSGTIGFRTPLGARIGVLPIAFAPLVLAFLVGVVVFSVGRGSARRATIAVAPLALVVLPWLPLPLPPAFLIWTGALTGPIWIGVAIALVSIVLWGVGDSSRARSTRRDVLSAVLAGCVVFGAAAWAASASIPSGDEPHYLVITESLLYDHDLNTENTYARGDYRAYYGGPLTPDVRARGRHGEIYSIHAPGLPAIVLPAFAVGGYRAVVVFLVLLSAFACGLAWWLALRETGSRAAAWFGWSVVALSAPFLLESFTVYPDPPGAALVLTGFWALRRIDRNEPASLMTWTLHGAALAVLPWLHTRFVLLAAVLGALIVFRLMRARSGAPRIAVFLTIPVVSAAAWLFSFYVMYGTPNPSAPYGGESNSAFAFLPNGLGGLLFDQGFGLLATAPALAVAFAGFARTRRFALEWSLTAVVYGVAVGSYAMWWAGSSGPARLLVPLLLPLAIPAACAWHGARSRGARVLMLAALVTSAWLSWVLAAGGGGLLGYHARNVYGMTAAPWLGWANRLVDLAQALPAFVPLPVGTTLGARIAAARAGFAATVPWIACFAAAAALVAWIGRRRDVTLPETIAASVGAFAAATMIAASIVWRMHDARPLTLVPSQLDVLRRLAASRTVAFDLSNARRIPNVDAMRMRMVFPVEPDVRSPATLASIPLVPAGSFVLEVSGTLSSPASVYAGADDEPFPLAIGSPADFARGVTLDLPVAVRALTVRAANSAGVAALEFKPTASRLARATDRIAHHAATYGSTSVFFVDDRTAPEFDGFWIWGAREGEVVFDSNAGEVPVVLRNGPLPNFVTIRSGDREQRLTLSPREERRVPVSSVTSIRTSGGFHPSDVDSHSQDRRYLGVFVVMPEHAIR